MDYLEEEVYHKKVEGRKMKGSPHLMKDCGHMKKIADGLGGWPNNFLY